VKASIWGGRALVRAVLYMCSLVAARRNPVLRAFYALLCKLLIILNALLRHQLPWSPEFAFDSPYSFSAACQRGGAIEVLESALAT
jgi:hypothetical protein